MVARPASLDALKQHGHELLNLSSKVAKVRLANDHLPEVSHIQLLQDGDVVYLTTEVDEKKITSNV